LFFSDLDDPDPIYHFSGVMFGMMEDEIIITEDELNSFLKEACDRYIEKNPEDKIKIENILKESED